jgi:hypothetical protein
MRKIGNEAFTFQVGKLGGGYRYCGITAPTNTTDVFTAEFIRAPANAPPRGLYTSVGPPPLMGVSACEYWTIDRTAGTFEPGIILSWNGLSPCNTIAYVNNPNVIVVAHYNGASWNKHGRTSHTSVGGRGDVLWTGLTGGFNTANTPFALGTLDIAESPLPVKLTVNASKTQNGNKIEWTNYTEQSVLSYELEKSANGITFTTSHSQQANTNNGGKADYKWIDVNPFSSVTYYRIRAIENNGNVVYSLIVKVQSGGNLKNGFTVYPNPVVSKQFTVELSSPAGMYKIKLVNNFGQEIMNTQWQHAGGSATKTIELAPSVGTGIYYLQLTGNNQNMQTKILVQ